MAFYSFRKADHSAQHRRVQKRRIGRHPKLLVIAPQPTPQLIVRLISIWISKVTRTDTNWHQNRKSGVSQSPNSHRLIDLQSCISRRANPWKLGWFGKKKNNIQAATHIRPALCLIVALSYEQLQSFSFSGERKNRGKD